METMNFIFTLRNMHGALSTHRPIVGSLSLLPSGVIKHCLTSKLECGKVTYFSYLLSFMKTRTNQRSVNNYNGPTHCFPFLLRSDFPAIIRKRTCRSFKNLEKKA